MAKRKRTVTFRDPEQMMRSPFWHNKPKGMKDWLTVEELARYCDRDPSRIRKLARIAETKDPSRFPIAKRVKMGELDIRLFSPRMRDEAKAIFESLPSHRTR